MKSCWAKNLGKCSNEMSKEHLLSAALWRSSSISVQGFSWCKESPREVGLNSIATHILCKVHNNALSPLDTSAAMAFDSLREATRLANGRDKLAPRGWVPVTYNIREPHLLERWFLKTCINLAVAQPSQHRWRQTGQPLNVVPQRLVQMAFGEESIVRPFGLYAAASVGDHVHLQDGVVFTPLLYGGPDMIAALFEFRGIRFVLHLEEHELPETLALPRSHDERWMSSQLLYRLRVVEWKSHGVPSHAVKFHWPP